MQVQSVGHITHDKLLSTYTLTEFVIHLLAVSLFYTHHSQCFILLCRTVSVEFILRIAKIQTLKETDDGVDGHNRWLKFAMRGCLRCYVEWGNMQDVIEASHCNGIHNHARGSCKGLSRNAGSDFSVKLLEIQRLVTETVSKLSNNTSWHIHPYSKRTLILHSYFLVGAFFCRACYATTVVHQYLFLEHELRYTLKLRQHPTRRDTSGLKLVSFV